MSQIHHIHKIEVSISARSEGPHKPKITTSNEWFNTDIHMDPHQAALTYFLKLGFNTDYSSSPIEVHYFRDNVLICDFVISYPNVYNGAVNIHEGSISKKYYDKHSHLMYIIEDGVKVKYMADDIPIEIEDDHARCPRCQKSIPNTRRVAMDQHRRLCIKTWEFV